jgi:hypothetical protein
MLMMWRFCSASPRGHNWAPSRFVEFSGRDVVLTASSWPSMPIPPSLETGIPSLGRPTPFGFWRATGAAYADHGGAGVLCPMAVFRTRSIATYDPRVQRGHPCVRAAVERANATLAARGQQLLPDGLTPHSLRRTFASLLFALGEPPTYVMSQMGHTTRGADARPLCPAR